MYKRLVKTLLVLLALLFIGSSSVHAQRPTWEFVPGALITHLDAKPFLHSVKADSLGGAVIVIEYRDDTSTRVGGRLVWLSRVGNFRHIEDLSVEDPVDLVRVSTTSFLASFSNTRLRRFFLSSGKAKFVETGMDTGERPWNPEAQEMPDSSGFFLVKQDPNGRLLKIRRFQNR